MTDFVYPSMRMDNKEKLHMVKVKDVASQIRGVTFAKSDVLKHAEKGYVPVLRAGNIEDATASVSWSDIVYIPTEKVRQVQFLRNNDVIIAASSGSLAAIGKCAQFESNDALCEDVSFGAFLKVLRLNAIDVDPQYFAHYFRTKEYRAIISHLASGANINNLRNQDIDNLEFYLPPLEEQRRIVEILDRADAIRAKRRQLLADYDELRANMFYDVFGVPSRWADFWSRTTIGALTESVQYGTSARAGTDGAWPILRMGNITDDGRLDLTDLKYIDLPKTDIPKYTVRAGDMLFNRTNSKEKVGKSCVVDTDQKLALAGYLVRVRFRNPMHAPFVSAFLNSTYGVKLRQRMAKAAVNQANINATEMKSIEVPAPSDVALREFARRVEAIAAARAKVERALALDDELFASLQSRAFRGVL